MSQSHETYASNFARRFIQDALSEADADYWERRAEVFASCGTETADEKALACLRHSWLLREIGSDWPTDVLRDVLLQMVDELADDGQVAA